MKEMCVDAYTYGGKTVLYHHLAMIKIFCLKSELIKQVKKFYIDENIQYIIISNNIK
jgi:hypothetical protein